MSDRILFICLEKNKLPDVTKLINSYKKINNNANIFLMYDKNHKTCVTIEAVTRIELDVDKMLLEIKKCGIDLFKRSVVLNNFLEKIVNYFFDLIVNLDYEKAVSSVISSYLNSKNVWGASYDEYGFPCFDNNRFKYLVYAKQNNNLFFYRELIYKAQDVELEQFKTNFEHSDKIICIFKQVNIAIEGVKVYDVKNFDLCNLDKDNNTYITDDELCASILTSSGMPCYFVSNSYYSFYDAYPSNNLIKYVLSEKIDNNLINNIKNVKNMLVYKPIQDKHGFIYIVPEVPINIDNKVFNFLVLKAVWKSIVNREVPVGDSKRFLSIGEKYIDRVMDVNLEIDFLKQNIFPYYIKTSIDSVIEANKSLLVDIDKFKKFSFDGVLKAKSYLHAVSSFDCDLDKIKEENKKLLECDSKIYNFETNNNIIIDFINYFKIEREKYHLRNLFPMVKNIIFTYENLYSKICFFEEILKGILNGG